MRTDTTCPLTYRVSAPLKRPSPSQPVDRPPCLEHRYPLPTKGAGSLPCTHRGTGLKTPPTWPGLPSPRKAPAQSRSGVPKLLFPASLSGLRRTLAQSQATIRPDTALLQAEGEVPAPALPLPSSGLQVPPYPRFWVLCSARQVAWRRCSIHARRSRKIFPIAPVIIQMIADKPE